MSKIIPISITTTEQAVTLDATYQFAWLRNMGENDVLLSDHCGIVAGDDNVTLVKAGESGRISTSGRAVYVKAVSGTSTGEIHAQNFSDAPFKSKAKGGGSGSGGSIYRTTTALTDGAETNPITVNGQEVTAVSGDFAVYNTQEFLFDGTQWNLLGDRVGLGDLAYKDTASGSYTPAGSVSVTQSQATYVYDGTTGLTTYTEAGAPSATFTGTAATITVG